MDANENDMLENADEYLHEAGKAEECGELVKETEKSEDFIDCDVFKFGYWSEIEASTSEVVKHIKKCLVKSLSDSKIKVEDQLFKIYDAKHIDKNEVEIMVKVKKGSVMLKQAVKKIRTSYVPGDSLEISLLSLSTT